MQANVEVAWTLATVVAMRWPATNVRSSIADGRFTSDRVLPMAVFRRFSLIDRGWPRTARYMALPMDACGFTPK